MRVILMRHAPTEPSAAHLVRGWADVRLSAAGRRWASRAGTALRRRALLPSVIVSSDTPRSLDTAHITARAGGSDAPIEPTPTLRDRCLGEWEGRPRRDFDAAIAANGGYRWTPRGAESLDAFRQRLGRAFDALLARPEPDALVVTHFGCLYWLLIQFGVIAGEADIASCDGLRPCGVTVLDMTVGRPPRLVDTFEAGALAPESACRV